MPTQLEDTALRLRHRINDRRWYEGVTVGTSPPCIYVHTTDKGAAESELGAEFMGFPLVVREVEPGSHSDLMED